MKFNSFFKNEKLAKIIMGVLLVVMILLVAGVAVVKAEDNKTIEFDDKGWPKILKTLSFTSSNHIPILSLKSTDMTPLVSMVCLVE